MIENQTVRTGLLIVAVIAILTTASAAYQRADKAATPSTASSSDTTAPAATPPSAVTLVETPQSGVELRDGVYTVTGEYTSPAGPEEITVTTTLTDGVISDVNVEALATNPASKKYQQQFIDGYTELVIGKPIDEVELDVVAGSSLTPKGFNEALEKIMQQAQT